MPLPTYAQSEKYETEGVLVFHKDTETSDTEDEAQSLRVGLAAGTWCEFVLFFISEWYDVSTIHISMYTLYMYVHITELPFSHLGTNTYAMCTVCMYV